MKRGIRGRHPEPDTGTIDVASAGLDDQVRSGDVCGHARWEICNVALREVDVVVRALYVVSASVRYEVAQWSVLMAELVRGFMSVFEWDQRAGVLCETLRVQRHLTVIACARKPLRDGGQMREASGWKQGWNAWRKGLGPERLDAGICEAMYLLRYTTRTEGFGGGCPARRSQQSRRTSHDCARFDVDVCNLPCAHWSNN